LDILTRQFSFAQIIPVSARKRDGMDLLVQKIVEALPTGERYYPKDQYTDQPQRSWSPNSSANAFWSKPAKRSPTPRPSSSSASKRPSLPLPPARRARRRLGCRLPASLRLFTVNATAKKAILIGKGGSKLKEIGTGARRQIESLLGTRVYLELHVIVEPGWRESKSFVESLDWRNQLEKLAGDQITEQPPDEDE